MLEHPDFVAGDVDTKFIERMFAAREAEEAA
ncbi:hypothetical protein BH23GEM4_BH23GEM4_07690 [soil metagenome]